MEAPPKVANIAFILTGLAGIPVAIVRYVLAASFSFSAARNLRRDLRAAEL